MSTSGPDNIISRRSVLHALLNLLWSSTIMGLGVWMLRGTSSVRRTLRKIYVGSRKDYLNTEQGRILQTESGSIFIHNRDANIYALSLQCTHGNCTVRYVVAQDKFICPCHGGVFDITGKVLKGPPSEPLRIVPVRIQGDSIYVIQ